MQEKLQKIKARCEELLAVAEKRTSGKWDDGNMREWFAAYTESQDAAFISSCTGNAEAGWKATIKAINLIKQETSDDMPPNSWDRLADLIITTWSEN